MSIGTTGLVLAAAYVIVAAAVALFSGALRLMSARQRERMNARLLAYYALLSGCVTVCFVALGGLTWASTVQTAGPNVPTLLGAMITCGYLAIFRVGKSIFVEDQVRTVIAAAEAMTVEDAVGR